MANIKSAMKRDRQARKRRGRNAAAESGLKTARSKLLAALAAKNREAGVTAYRAYCSRLDKLAKQGIIARNTAIRSKARAAARVRQLGAA